MQDALRAKRNQEEAERNWRRKEKEDAEKKYFGHPCFYSFTCNCKL